MDTNNSFKSQNRKAESKNEYFITSRSFFKKKPENQTSISLKIPQKKFRKLSETPSTLPDFESSLKTTRSLSQNQIFLSEISNLEKDPEFQKTLPDFSFTQNLNKRTFPFKKLSPRIMALSINDWCKNILTNTREKGFAQGIDILLKSLNAAHIQLSTEISEHCKEQGMLMNNLWDALLKVVDNVLFRLMSSKLNSDKNRTQSLSDIHRRYQEKLDQMEEEKEKAKSEANAAKQEAEQIAANNTYLSKKISKLSQDIFASKSKLSLMKTELSELFDELVKEKGKTRGLQSQIADLESENKKRSVYFIDMENRFSKKASITGKTLEVPSSKKRTSIAPFVPFDFSNIQDHSLDKSHDLATKHDLVFVDNEGISYAIKEIGVNTDPPNHTFKETSTSDLFFTKEKSVSAVVEYSNAAVLAVFEKHLREAFVQTENLMIEGSQKVFSRLEYNAILNLLNSIGDEEKEKSMQFEFESEKSDSEDSISLEFSNSYKSLASPLKTSRKSRVFDTNNIGSFVDNFDKADEFSETNKKFSFSQVSQKLGIPQKLMEQNEQAADIQNEAVISLLVPETKHKKLKKASTEIIQPENVKSNFKNLSKTIRRQTNLIKKLTEMLIRSSLLQEQDLLTFETAQTLITQGKKYHRNSLLATTEIKNTVKMFHSTNKKLEISLQEEKLSHAETKSEALRTATKLDSLWKEFEALNNDVDSKELVFQGVNSLAPEFQPETKLKKTLEPKLKDIKKIPKSSNKPSPNNSVSDLNSPKSSKTMTKISFVKPFNLTQRKVKIQRTTSVNAENANRILNKAISTKKLNIKAMLPKSNIQKFIRDIYAEKVRQLRGNERENPLHVVTYDFFLNRYGFRQLAESKLITFLEACTFHKNDKKILLFGRLFGVFDPLDYDDFEFFISSMASIESAPIPIPKAVDFCIKIIKSFEKEEFESLVNGRNTIDSEELLHFMMNTRIRQNSEIILRLKEVYMAGDVDNDQSIDYFEFTMLFRYMEPSQYTFLKASVLFYSRVDLFDEEENDGSMTFGVFAKTANEFKIFSAEKQLEFANGALRVGDIHSVFEIRENWKEISNQMKAIFMKTNSFDKFHLKMLQKIDRFVTQEITNDKSEEKTIWFIYRFLSEECASCIVDSQIKSFIPDSILDIDFSLKQLLLGEIKNGKLKDEGSSRMNTLITEN